MHAIDMTATIIPAENFILNGNSMPGSGNVSNSNLVSPPNPTTVTMLYPATIIVFIVPPLRTRELGKRMRNNRMLMCARKKKKI
jgi:hypothetical protein